MAATWLLLICGLAMTASAEAQDLRSTPRYIPRSSKAGAVQRASRIEIDGVTALSPDEVASVVVLQPGEVIDREKVLESVENLRRLYFSKGFASLNIRTELASEKLPNGNSETVFRFILTEGRPTRVKDLSFSLVSDSDFDQKEVFRLFWLRMEKRVRSKISLASGDLFDQDKIQAAKRQILEALASKDYLAARVGEVKVTRAIAPEGHPQANEADWLTVEFAVDPGDRVTFGFREAGVFSSSELFGWINEQRLRGFGDDYVSDIRRRLEEEYRKIGFAHVKIEVLTFERNEKKERHVTFVVTEGTRVVIDRVDFDGNLRFPSEELRKQFFARAPDLVQKNYYAQGDAQKAGDLLVEWMRSQGYLSASLASVNASFIDDGKKARLMLYLQEGEKTVLEAVEINGLTILSREKALSILGIAEEQPLNLYAFTDGIEALKARYRAEGYLDFVILNETEDGIVRYDDENRKARIVMTFEEGPKFKVSRIEVEGLGRTKKSVVMNQISLREGKLLTETALVESEGSLKRLGIFSSVEVQIHTDPEAPGAKVVRIKLSEGTPGVWGVGGGIRNDLGLRLFGSAGYTNLWGRNHSIQLTGSVNRRFDLSYCNIAPCFIEFQSQLAYNWPHLIIPGLNLRPRVATEHIRYIDFDALAFSGGVTLEKRLFAKPNTVLALDYTLERILQENAKLTLDNGVYRIGSLTPSLRFDWRDNPLTPRKGIYAETSFEWASTALGSQTTPFPVGYTRFQARADGHIPLGKRASWYFSFRTGLARNLEPPPEGAVVGAKDYAIPLSKVFVLGGAGSIRGFRERGVNENKIAIRGTLSYVNYRTQLDLPIVGDLRFGPFLDAGNLHVDRFLFGDLRWGAGVGFRYISPVGPINFDVGFNLFPRADESGQQFYFSIGVI